MDQTFWCCLQDDSGPEQRSGPGMTPVQAAQGYVDAVDDRSRIVATTVVTEQVGAFPPSRYRFAVTDGVVDVASAVALP